VEKENNSWVLQISASLNAFILEIELILQKHRIQTQKSFNKWYWKHIQKQNSRLVSMELGDISTAEQWPEGYS